MNKNITLQDYDLNMLAECLVAGKTVHITCPLNSERRKMIMDLAENISHRNHAQGIWTYGLISKDDFTIRIEF